MLSAKTEGKKIELRMTIDGKLGDRLKAIKEDRGLENYTELIRTLINEAYERLKLLGK